MIETFYDNLSNLRDNAQSIRGAIIPKSVSPEMVGDSLLGIISLMEQLYCNDYITVTLPFQFSGAAPKSLCQVLQKHVARSHYALKVKLYNISFIDPSDPTLPPVWGDLDDGLVSQPPQGAPHTDDATLSSNPDSDGQLDAESRIFNMFSATDLSGRSDDEAGIQYQLIAVDRKDDNTWIHFCTMTVYYTDNLSEVSVSLSPVASQLIGNSTINLQPSTDITVTDNQLTLTDRAKRQLLIDIAAQEGITHNEETGLFAYSTITDLTYTDVINMLSAGRLNMDNCDSFYANNTKLRTNLAPIECWNSHTLTHALWGCSSMEVFNAKKCAMGYAAFSGCKKLHTITGVLTNNGGNLGSCFNSCASLRSLQIKLAKAATSFSLEWCPLIDLASMQYIVANAVNTNTVTITVHPSVYAKLTGDPDSVVVAALTPEEGAAWQALVPLALEKNISFATL